MEENTENVIIEASSQNINQKNTEYEVDENGTAVGSGLYTGPKPAEPVDVNSKNNLQFEVTDQGTLVDDAAIYTGPMPKLPKNPSAKNNKQYHTNELGTFSDSDLVYTGPTPLSTERAQEAQKEYDSLVLKRSKQYEKLKKWQRNNLRHAGYKYKPEYTILTNS